MFGLEKFRRNHKSKSSLDNILECAQTDLGRANIIEDWKNPNEINKENITKAINTYVTSSLFYSAQNLAQKYGLTERVIELKKLEAERAIEERDFSRAARILENIDSKLALDLWGKSFNQVQSEIKEFKSSGKKIPNELSEEICEAAYHIGKDEEVLRSGFRGYRTCGGHTIHDYVFNVQQKRGMWKEAFEDSFTNDTIYAISCRIQEAKTPEQIKDYLRNSQLSFLANNAGDESRKRYFSYVANSLSNRMDFKKFESAIDEDMRGEALKSYLAGLRNPNETPQNKSFSKLFGYGLAKDALEFMDQSNCLEGTCGFSIADIAKLKEDEQNSIKKVLMEYLLDKIEKYRNKKAFFKDSYLLRAIEASIYCDNPALAEKIFNKEYMNSDDSPLAIANAAKAAGLREPEVKYAKRAIVENESRGDFERALYLCEYHGLDDLIPRYERIVSILKKQIKYSLNR
ncbi:MAG TPA: hypothetical protein VJ438_03925 [Candidatus Nanoarchaeia archaeon]|nr:hypothetical protein [Candidatus Nanoarchaeia archaeon]